MSAELAALARSVFALGFAGRTAAEAPLAALRAFGPGAVILFARNAGTPDELRELCAALRGTGGLPPLIAVDQEGGRVARIGAPVTPLPAAMALGSVADPALCEALAAAAGRDLAGLGISVNLAPVADLALDPADVAIGTRAYGTDPAAVARLVTATARGYARGGVAPALKHFPGHGATAVDSHLALPRIETGLATLRARDLVPFAAAVAAGDVAIVLTAHAIVAALDPERAVTWSPAALALLRGELGFDGVVCTDCLEMGAVTAGLGTVAAAVAALAAGADLLLVSHTPALADEAAAAVVAAVAAGTLPEARLREAAARVRRLRERMAAVAAPSPGPERALALAAAQRAVTVVRGAPQLAAGRPVSVISFEGAAFDGAAGERVAPPSLSAALRARRWKSELMRVALEPDPADVDLLLEHLAALGDRNVVVVTRRAHLAAGQRAAVGRIVAAIPDTLVVSAREPYDALLWPAACRVVCIYGDDELAFAGCADVLSGIAQPAGRLPVAIADVVR